MIGELCRVCLERRVTLKGNTRCNHCRRLAHAESEKRYASSEKRRASYHRYNTKAETKARRKVWHCLRVDKP